MTLSQLYKNSKLQQKQIKSQIMTIDKSQNCDINSNQAIKSKNYDTVY